MGNQRHLFGGIFLITQEKNGPSHRKSHLENKELRIPAVRKIKYWHLVTVYFRHRNRKGEPLLKIFQK